MDCSITNRAGAGDWLRAKVTWPLPGSSLFWTNPPSAGVGGGYGLRAWTSSSGGLLLSNSSCSSSSNSPNWSAGGGCWAGRLSWRNPLSGKLVLRSVSRDRFDTKRSVCRRLCSSKGTVLTWPPSAIAFVLEDTLTTDVAQYDVRGLLSVSACTCRCEHVSFKNETGPSKCAANRLYNWGLAGWLPTTSFRRLPSNEENDGKTGYAPLVFYAFSEKRERIERRASVGGRHSSRGGAHRPPFTLSQSQNKKQNDTKQKPIFRTIEWPSDRRSFRHRHNNRESNMT